MRFLYYMPGARSQADAETMFAQHGLRKSIQADNLMISECSEGPDGDNGVICGHRAPGLPIAYRPEDQRWNECDGGKFFVGYWTEHKPEPAALVRDRRIIDGNEVEGWTVPLVKPVIGPTRLPHTQRLESDGTVTHTPLSRYVSLLDKVDAMYEALQEHNQIDMDDEDAYAFAGELLNVNYYVGKWEISALAPTNIFLQDVLFASFDLPHIPEFVKECEELTANG